MTLLLFTVTFVLAILSLISRRADRISALLIAVLLIFSSGLRRYGYDYYEYETLIDNVRDSSFSDVDFAYRLVIGKDPVFILVIDILTFFNSDERWPVFLIFAFIAVITKYIAALSLPRYSAIFLAIYLIFLSPTLEFSGIRSAAAIGILMMVVAYPMQWGLKLFLLVASAATHISLVFSALISFFTPHFSFTRWRLVFLMIIMALVAALSSDLLNIQDESSDVLNIQNRSVNFIGKTGTIFALLFPFIISILFVIQILASDKFNDKIYLNIALIIGISLGLALPSVGISHRLLEIGKCLFLFVMVRDLAIRDFENLITNRNRQILILTLSGFIGLEFVHHIYNGSWLAITIL